MPDIRKLIIDNPNKFVMFLENIPLHIRLKIISNTMIYYSILDENDSIVNDFFREKFLSEKDSLMEAFELGLKIGIPYNTKSFTQIIDIARKTHLKNKNIKVSSSLKRTVLTEKRVYNKQQIESWYKQS